MMLRLPKTFLLKQFFSQYGKLAVLFALLLFNSKAVTANTNTLLVLGDSISAAYGMELEKGWVALLAEEINDNASTSKYQVINASISGETTGGALKRFPELIEKYQPTIVIIELGGNDGLRGYPIKVFRENLEKLIILSKEANAKVLLAGMAIPPNYGPRYTREFTNSYSLLAEKYQSSLVPFILDDIAIYPELMQADGIHPTEGAQRKILENVLPYLKEIL